jgi:hypothetical protein
MSPVNKRTLPKQVTVVPAYGRDYKSRQEVLEAWNDQKDFVIQGLQGGGTYINKQDADRFNVAVKIRYQKKTKALIIYPQDNDTE